MLPGPKEGILVCVNVNVNVQNNIFYAPIIYVCAFTG